MTDHLSSFEFHHHNDIQTELGTVRTGGSHKAETVAVTNLLLHHW